MAPSPLDHGHRTLLVVRPVGPGNSTPWTEGSVSARPGKPRHDDSVSSAGVGWRRCRADPKSLEVLADPAVAEREREPEIFRSHDPNFTSHRRPAHLYFKCFCARSFNYTIRSSQPFMSKTGDFV